MHCIFKVLRSDEIDMHTFQAQESGDFQEKINNEKQIIIK